MTMIELLLIASALPTVYWIAVAIDWIIWERDK